MAVRADNLPSGLDYAVFDYAVNSGPRRAIEHLQEVLGVAVDGLMGNVTIATAAAKPAEGVIAKLCDRRMKFLEDLSTWDTFGKGWTRRVDGVRSKALSMASINPSQPDVAPTVPPLPSPPPEPISAKRSIGEVMFWIVGALLAGIAAVFFGGK
jgi:lysozyme family protein